MQVRVKVSEPATAQAGCAELVAALRRVSRSIVIHYTAYAEDRPLCCWFDTPSRKALYCIGYALRGVDAFRCVLDATDVEPVTYRLESLARGPEAIEDAKRLAQHLGAVMSDVQYRRRDPARQHYVKQLAVARVRREARQRASTKTSTT